MKTFICAWIFFWTASTLSATEMYWTEEAKNAYSLISALRIDEGLTIIRLQSITYPDNHIWPYLEDYGEFVKIFVQEDLRKIPAYMTASVARLEKISLVPESNPLSLMAQAQLLLHQCALHLQQGQLLGAATDINKSFKLLRRIKTSYLDVQVRFCS